MSAKMLFWPLASLGIVCFVAPDAIAAGPKRCLNPTATVAGDLRKVVSRRASTREEIVNWHILPAEPICVSIGSSTMPIGVKGRTDFPPDDAYTSSIVVMDAVLYNDMDDSGGVRRK